MKVVYIDGHLVNVDAFLDTEFGNEDVEGSVQYTDDLGLTYDGTISLS